MSLNSSPFTSPTKWREGDRAPHGAVFVPGRAKLVGFRVQTEFMAGVRRGGV
jgi:hypothetical protein